MIRRGSCGRSYRYPIVVGRHNGRLDSTLVGVSSSNDAKSFTLSCVEPDGDCGVFALNLVWCDVKSTSLKQWTSTR